MKPIEIAIYPDDYELFNINPWYLYIDPQMYLLGKFEAKWQERKGEMRQHCQLLADLDDSGDKFSPNDGIMTVRKCEPWTIAYKVGDAWSGPDGTLWRRWNSKDEYKQAMEK